MYSQVEKQILDIEIKKLIKNYALTGQAFNKTVWNSETHESSYFLHASTFHTMKNLYVHDKNCQLISWNVMIFHYFVHRYTFKTV